MNKSSESPETSLQSLFRNAICHYDIISELRFAILAVDGDGFVFECNPAASRLLGVSKASMLGRALKHLPIDWSWPDLDKHLIKMASSREAVRCDDLDFSRADGSRGILGVTLTPFESNPESGSFLLTAVDVSQRRALEHQLNQAQKLEAVGRLAAGVAHEINTPTQFVGDNLRFLTDAFQDILKLLDAYGSLLDALAATGGHNSRVSELKELSDEVDLDYLVEEVPRSIAQAIDGTSRVAEIVRAMKEFSHPSGAKDYADLNRALEGATTVSRNEWKYVAQLGLELDQSLPKVNCQLGELNQAFLNLIVNAAQAVSERYGTDSGGQGSIVVRSRPLDEKNIEISVADNGIGMSEEVRLRCFEQFFTTKEVGKGTGQGLALVHRVVTGHGGLVHVESRLGEGTTFFVRLPVDHR